MPDQRKRKELILNSPIEVDIFKAATRFSDQVLSGASDLLTVWGMTPLQFNALRVLYVEDTEDIGIPSKEVGSRLYTRVPDVTRLLDRMVEKGWITRERDTVNKRIVRSRLTDLGIELVESASGPLSELELEHLNHLNDDEKKELSALLKKALNKQDRSSVE